MFTVIGVDLAPELAMSDNLSPVQVDLTSQDGIEAVVAAVDDADLPLLGVVNNAGITRDARLINMTDEEFAAVLDINLGAAYRLTTAQYEAGDTLTLSAFDVPDLSGNIVDGGVTSVSFGSFIISKGFVNRDFWRGFGGVA